MGPAEELVNLAVGELDHLVSVSQYLRFAPYQGLTPQPDIYPESDLYVTYQ